MTAAKKAKEFNELLEKQAAESSPKNILIHFSATWCGPCKKIEEDWLKYTSFLKPEDFHVMEVDVDRNEYVTGYFGVKSLPTFIIVNDGKETGRISSSSLLSVFKWIDETSRK